MATALSVALLTLVLGVLISGPSSASPRIAMDHGACPPLATCVTHNVTTTATATATVTTTPPPPTATATETATAYATETVYAQPVEYDCTTDDPCVMDLDDDTEAWMLGAACLLVFLVGAFTVAAWGRDG